MKRKKDTTSNRLTWHLMYFTFIYAILIATLVAITENKQLLWLFGTWFPVAATGIRSHYVKAKDENVERFKLLAVSKLLEKKEKEE